MIEASAERFSESEVRAGENSGRMLKHDFVVREMIGPLSAGNSGRMRWSGTVALHGQWKRPDLGLVAFVQGLADGDVLQAQHAPLCVKP